MFIKDVCTKIIWYKTLQTLQRYFGLSYRVGAVGVGFALALSCYENFSTGKACDELEKRSKIVDECIRAEVSIGC